MKKLVAAGVFLVLAIVAIPRLMPAYRHLMAGRLLKAAEKARANHHYDEAARIYSLAIQRDMNHVALLHSFAGFLDEARRPEVLAVRLRLVQLEPENVTARLDAAEAALRFRKIAVAQRLLAKTSPELENHPRYYDLLGWMRVLSYDLRDADAIWTVALEKNPGNRIFEANLATVRLSSLDETTRGAAIDKLEQLMMGDQPPLSACSSFMVFAAQSPNEPPKLDQMLERFRVLIPPANPFFTSYLDAVRKWRPGRFNEAVASYVKTAASAQETAMTAQDWMVTSRLYEEFLAFRASLPAPWQENQQSNLIEAEALFNLHRTDALDSFLNRPDWNMAPPLKMAWQERIRRLSQPPDGEFGIAANRKWSGILAAAGKNEQWLNTLSRMAFTWGWKEEYALSLQALADNIPSVAPDALDNLFQFHMRNRDARNLRQVIVRQLALQPDNPNLQNNLAFLSFLLGIDTAKATKMSADLCAQHPKTPLFISTRAFGFFKADRTAEGLDLFKEIDVQRLRGTASGVCYGYLLADKHDPAAIDYLKDAEKWVGFPEEIDLVTAARRKVNSSSVNDHK